MRAFKNSSVLCAFALSLQPFMAVAQETNAVEVVDELVDARVVARRLEGAPVQIRRLRVLDSRHGRREGTPPRVRSHTRRHERATMVADAQCDDLGPAGRQARHH